TPGSVFTYGIERQKDQSRENLLIMLSFHPPGLGLDTGWGSYLFASYNILAGITIIFLSVLLFPFLIAQWRMNGWIFVLLLSGLLFSIRQEYKNDKILKTIEVTKVVINKNVSVQTELTYSYNVFNGNFYQQPITKSVYKIFFEDGASKEVSEIVYLNTKIGDSFTMKEFRWEKK
ncbi:MAG TPA: hypothetical protein PKO16_02315, partial [Bacteroidia bacterium]|nr:hypothetical protein [Bacteroidia bacterium]